MQRPLTFISIMVFLALVSVPKAYCQVEFYGGFSHLQLNGAPSEVGSSTNGWAGDVYLHLLGPWGIEADYSNHYGVSPVPTSPGYYVPGFAELYGPRFTLALPGIHPFVHALFGTIHGETAFPPSPAFPCGPLGCPVSSDLPLRENAVGMAFGGGLNVKATRHIWLRLVQLDYLRAQFTNNPENDTRISGGLIFRFGKW